MRNRTNEEYLLVGKNVIAAIEHDPDIFKGQGLSIPDMCSRYEKQIRWAENNPNQVGNKDMDWCEDAGAYRHGYHAGTAGLIGELYAQIILYEENIYSSITDAQDKHVQAGKKADLFIERPHWHRPFAVQVKTCIVDYVTSYVKVYPSWFDGFADRLLVVDIERGLFFMGDREQFKLHYEDHRKESSSDDISIPTIQRWCRLMPFGKSGVNKKLLALSQSVGV